MQTVNQACSKGLRNCTDLKNSIVHALRYVKRPLTWWEPEKAWQELLEKAKETEDLTSYTLRDMKSLAEDAISQQMEEDYKNVITSKVLDKQRGGFLVHSTQVIGNASGTPLFVPNTDHARWHALNTYWNDLQTVSKTSSVDVEGLVVERGFLPDGTNWVKIDPQRAVQGTWSAVSKILWLALALFLLAWSLVRLYSAIQRNQLIQADIAKRPAPDNAF